MNDLVQYGHEFVYRSDFDQCSICGGTHGKDPFAAEAQIRRLMAERDLLLGAIASEDYAKIKDQMVRVSESPEVK